MKSIADFKYTPMADMGVYIVDFIEVIEYLQQLEKEVAELRTQLEAMKEGND